MVHEQDNGEWFDRETGEAMALAVPATVEVLVNAEQQPQMVPPDQLPDFDEMEAGMSLAAKYIEFEQPGQKLRGLLIGFNQMTGQDGAVKPVAVFQNKDGVFVNAGSNLVSQVRHLPPKTSVEVTYMGKEKTGNGYNVKVFEVRLLNKPKLVTDGKPNIPDVNIGPGIKIKSKQPA